jgi:hypothetical protein
MSLLLWVSAALIVGMLLGPVFVILLAPAFDGLAKWLVKQGIRAGGDWVLKPVGGTQYDLEPVEYDDAEGKAWRAGGEDDDEREYFDDHGGKMRTLFGKSFGLAVDDDIAAIVDAVDAKVGEKEAAKVADGGTLDDGTKSVLEDLRAHAHIGSMEKSYQNGLKQRIDYVNPFVELTDEDRGTIVDVRDAVTLLSKNGSPETPRKTAENAAAAERAFEDWGELKRNASLIAAFLMGAIVTEFIAGGGGGGGGGGISSPIMLGGRLLLDMGAVLLGAGL